MVASQFGHWRETSFSTLTITVFLVLIPSPFQGARPL